MYHNMSLVSWLCIIISENVCWRNALNFHLDEKPKIHELQLLHGEDGETVRVINEAAAKWEELAYGLHFESHDVANIKKNNPSDVTAACREVLIQWEAGKGRKPVEWRTLLQALEDAQLDEVAPKLRSVLCSKKTKWF